MSKKPKRKMKLPDAMPEVEPTLLVVCDTHQCLFIDVGHHTLLLSDTVHSREETFTDHEGRFQSPAAFGKGGLVSGTADTNVLEKNRLREFANVVGKHILRMMQSQKIEEWYLAAPEKFLSILREHLNHPLKEKLRGELAGNFVKESPRQILLRFRPELEAAVKNLREEESYSPKKHLPRRHTP